MSGQGPEELRRPWDLGGRCKRLSTCRANAHVGISLALCMTVPHRRNTAGLAILQ